MNKRSDGSWIMTYTGKRFYPLDPRPEDIDIKDIAHALSMCNRYAGHSLFPYSVAEHSVRVSEKLPQELKLKGLLHDASEAYLCDIPRPLKTFLPDYQVIEALVMEVIGEKFGLGYICTPEVKEVDTRMLVTEAPKLFPHAQEAWWFDDKYPQGYGDVFIEGWSPGHAERKFLKTFEELT